MYSGPMFRILVVDDSFTARSIIARLIGDRYELVQADGGAQALALLGSGSFDLVLLDLLMPGMDGFQTLRAIKERAPDLPVLVLSADIQESTRRRVLAAGAVQLIHKPPKQDSLIAAIEEGLQGRSGAGSVL